MSEKKGFFGKISGVLFEEGDEQQKTTYSAEELAAMVKDLGTNPVTVPEGMEMNDLLTAEEIYTKFNLSDRTRSIFKVEDFANIPGIDKLPTDVKRTSVIGIITTSGLTVEELIADAESRTNALTATKDSFTAETTEIITNAEAEIERLQAEMDALKTTINNRKSLQESQDKLINEEFEKVDKIVKFINPTV